MRLKDFMNRYEAMPPHVDESLTSSSEPVSLEDHPIACASSKTRPPPTSDSHLQMAADAKKTVVLSYQGSNKKVAVPQTKGMTDVQYLEEEFKKRFNFTETNVKVTFQHLDEDFGGYIDLEDGDEICHKEKLNVVVIPILSPPSSVPPSTQLETKPPQPQQTSTSELLHTEDSPMKHISETKPKPKLELPVETEIVKTKPSQEDHSTKLEQPRLAMQMKAMCGLPIENGPPKVYKLPTQQVMTDATKSIAKCHIGRPDSACKSPEKVLMVLGATGAGKSTLINGMANYILGVEWEDDFRFKLIVDEPGTAGKSQAHSQTSWITAYTFHKMGDNSRVPYTLTIIDTPGFGDTRGLKRDRQITSQIKEFFSIPDKDGGIDHLDGIGFVTQASLARLTPTQQYIFDSILATFGKDIANNIFMMVTFADGNKPPVLAAVKEAQIPFEKAFKFNNSALFTKADEKDEQGAEDDEDFAQMFWKMGVKSFKTFFVSYAKAEPKSLQLTKEVLDERQKLEATIQGLQTKVKNGLSQIDVLSQEERILKARQSEINANKNFKYKVKVPKTRQVDLKGSGTYVTNCLQCNFTCHHPCGISNDQDKYNCAAMDKRGESDATCSICSCHGSWTKHVNNPYRYEEYEEEEERTVADLKKRYEEAMSGKTKAESMISNMENHLQFMYTKVLEMVHTIKKSLNRLGDIALKPNPLTEVEYIELLIQSEKDQAKDGWQQRVQYYEEMKQQAMLLKAAANEKEITKMLNKPPGKSWWERFKFW